MALFVNTNATLLNALRQVRNSPAPLNTSFERLSSGFRINRAADDLQRSDRLTMQFQGLNQGVLNANDGISVTHRAEGAFGEVTFSPQCMRQLAVQSQNGINSFGDGGAVQNRFQSTMGNLSHISENTASARWRIRDAGFSTECADFNRNQVIQKTPLTIMSLANQRPQSALSLLD
ncbi:MAG: flagellin [Paraglaciecola sp.]|jgi:flagellin